jgi:hypothetical protein
VGLASPPAAFGPRERVRAARPSEAAILARSIASSRRSLNSSGLRASTSKVVKSASSASLAGQLISGLISHASGSPSGSWLKKVSPSGHVLLDQGDQVAVDERRELFVDGRAADHEALLVDPRRQRGAKQGILDAGRSLAVAAFREQAEMAADDDVVAPRQGAASERVERLAAHDHDIVERLLAEEFHVAAQAPRQAVLAADDAVPIDRDDGGQAPHFAPGRPSTPWRTAVSAME